MKNLYIKNYLLSIFSTVLSLVFPLITFPYVSRILGSENLGIINFAQSYGYYFIHIANFGISSYAIREISKVRDDKDELEIKTNEIFNLNFLFSLLSWIAYIGVAFFVPKLKKNILILLVYSVMIISNFLSLEWVLQSFDDYFFSTVRSSIVRVLALVAVFVLINDKNDYIIYMAISTISEMGARLATLRYTNRKYVKLQLRRKYLNFKEHFYSMFTLFTFRMVNGISAQLDKLMIGFMMLYSDVGVYSAGVKIVLMIAPLIETVGIVLFPTINIAANESGKKYLEAVRLNYNIILLMAVPMVAGLFLVAPMIIKVFSGDEYVGAINVLRIMAIVVLLCPVGDLLGSKTLLVHNKNKELLICSCIVAVSNIVLNAILIPTAGINGAAVASVAGYIIAILARLYYTNKLFRFRLLTLDLLKYIIYTIPFFLGYYYFREIIDTKVCFFTAFIVFCVLCYLSELIIFKDKTFQLVRNKFFERKMYENQ